MLLLTEPPFQRRANKVSFFIKSLDSAKRDALIPGGRGAVAGFGVLLATASAILALNAPSTPADPTVKPVSRTASPAAASTDLLEQAQSAIKQGKREEADRLYRLALDVERKSRPPAQDQLARIYSGLAANLKAHGNPAAADAFFRAALALRRKALGEKHADTASAYNDVASNLKALGKYAEADPLFRKALEIKRRTLGEQDPATATGYNNLGSNLKAQGRLAEAERFFRRGLEIRLAAFGERHPDTAAAYNNVASSLQAQGKSADAEPLFRKSLEIKLITLGEADPDVALALNNLARNLDEQSKHAEAEPLLRRALDIRRSALGEEHPDTASSYNNLAENLDARGKFKDAEELFRRALAIQVTKFGEKHPKSATSYVDLAKNLKSQGKYDAAEPFFRRSIELHQALFGDMHPATAAAFNALGSNLKAQAKLREAGAMFRRSLDVRLQILGEKHPETAESYNDLASNMKAEGKYRDADPLFRKALELKLSLLGESHRSTGLAYNNIASNLKAMGRYVEAERFFERALEIKRSNLGDGHPDVATAYNNLASILKSQGKLRDAEALFRKSLDIRRQSLGEAHPDTAAAYNNIGSILRAQRRWAEAAALFTQALEIKRAAVGEDHPQMALAYNNLATVLDAQGDYPAAEGLLRKALDIRRGKLGENHPATANSYQALGQNMLLQNRKEEAESLLRRALKITESTLGPEHPELVKIQTQLSTLLALEPATRSEALAFARSAVSIVRTRRLRQISGKAVGEGASEAEEAFSRATGQAGSVSDPLAYAFTTLLNSLWAANKGGEADPAALINEAFAAAQDLGVSAAGQAFVQTAARTAAGKGELAAAVRLQQDLSAKARELDESLLKAVRKADAQAATRIRSEIQAIGSQLAVADGNLRQSFPEYAELVSPKAISAEEVQTRLLPGEGLLLIIPAGEDVYSFAIARSGSKWNRVAGAQKSVTQRVDKLLCQVDTANCSAVETALETLGIKAVDPDAIPEFDFAAAHALYAELVEPVESALAGVVTVHVTTSGRLSALPLSILRIRPPASAQRDAPVAYGDEGWLTNKYALTNLPAVSALRALRKAGGARLGEAASFVGYGAPKFRRTRGSERSKPTRGGILSDTSSIENLDPLPGTQVELSAMARLLGAPASAVRTGPAATEAAVKNDSSIPTARVIAFATHGLLGNELSGFDEPGLVLTPPGTPTVLDDGILGASEAAELNLSSDWVILSACNTASSDASDDGENLSSLARSFIYAGAAALLASHWRIGDDVTAALTVETLSASRNSSGRSRAEAHQIAMKTVRTGLRPDGTRLPKWKAAWAHPAAWGPFSLISN